LDEIRTKEQLLLEIPELRKQLERLRYPCDGASRHWQEASQVILDSILESIPEGVIVSGGPSRLPVLSISRYGREMLGGGSDLIGLSLADLLGPWNMLDADENQGLDLSEFPLYRAVMEREVIRNREMILVRPDGAHIPILCNAAPILGLNHEVLGGVCSWREIPELKEAEKILHKRHQEFKALVENNPDVIARLDHNHRFLYLNPASEALSGMAPVQIIGKRFQEVIKSSEEDMLEAEKVIERVLRTGKEDSVELPIRLNGRRKVFQIRVAPERDAEGSIRTVLCIARDVTRIRQQEQMLRKAQEEAELASRAKSEFLASMSHEIRTPLGGILGMTELLMARVAGDSNQSYLELIENSAMSLLGILNDILDLSKIEAGKVDLEPEEFEFREEMLTLAEPFRLQAEKRGLSFDVRLDSAIPERMHGDLEKLKQILRNLLSNAVKFTVKGGVTLTTDLAEKCGDQCRLRFTVSDTGIGIPRHKQRSLFGMFEQLRDHMSKNCAGTGLGLAISKRLAGMLGGDISLESEKGLGSTFTFTAALTCANGSSRQNVCRPDASALSHLPPLRILVAEDNPINQIFIQALLQDAGHDVRIAPTGCEVLEVLARDCFDCVLMDVQMPEMDGMETTRRIRAMAPPLCDIPIIALTAYAMKEDQERIMSAGMDGYVTKPVDIAEFSRVLREKLAHARPEAFLLPARSA
jgi:PAS domain S-box-containing protein